MDEHREWDVAPRLRSNETYRDGSSLLYHRKTNKHVNFLAVRPYRLSRRMLPGAHVPRHAILSYSGTGAQVLRGASQRALREREQLEACAAVRHREGVLLPKGNAWHRYAAVPTDSLRRIGVFCESSPDVFFLDSKGCQVMIRCELPCPEF